MGNSEQVTTAEAVRISGYSRYKLYRLVQQGRLQIALKLPTTTGAYLFNRADIEALAKADAA